jgi:hypothetical protein
VNQDELSPGVARGAHRVTEGVEERLSPYKLHLHHESTPMLFTPEHTYQVFAQFKLADRDDMSALFHDALARLTLT